MRVAVLSSAYPYSSGETFLEPELRGLAAEHDLVVWPVSHRARGRARPSPVPYDARELFAPATLWLAAREAARAPLRCAKVLAEVLLDRSAWHAKPKNLALLPKALALAQVARAQQIEHLHAYWLSTPATVAYVVSRLTGIPWSASAHRWDIYEGNMVARKLRSAQFVRAISERGRRDLALREPAARERIPLVRVGIAVPDAAPHDPRLLGPLRMLCAGNLVPVKGHRYLIEALAIARSRGTDARLTVAGDGPLRTSLEQLGAAAGVAGAIDWRGRVPHAQILNELRSGQYDVAVLASVEQGRGLMEGVPIALAEAMAHGVPCIGTDSGSIPELLSGGAGIVVAHSDAQALADAIVQLAADPVMRATMGSAARGRVERDFDHRRTTMHLARLIGGRSTGD